MDKIILMACFIFTGALYSQAVRADDVGVTLGSYAGRGDSEGERGSVIGAFISVNRNMGTLFSSDLAAVLELSNSASVYKKEVASVNRLYTYDTIAAALGASLSKKVAAKTKALLRATAGLGQTGLIIDESEPRTYKQYTSSGFNSAVINAEMGVVRRFSEGLDLGLSLLSTFLFIDQTTAVHSEYSGTHTDKDGQISLLAGESSYVDQGLQSMSLQKNISLKLTLTLSI